MPFPTMLIRFHMNTSMAVVASGQAVRACTMYRNCLLKRSAICGIHISGLELKFGFGRINGPEEQQPEHSNYGCSSLPALKRREGMPPALQGPSGHPDGLLSFCT